MELINKLGIDWKLLVAQVINFSILLFILAKFVYKPVLHTLEKRRKTIEKGLKDAEESERRLKEVEKTEAAKLTSAQREIGRLMESARTDAEQMKKEIVEDAKRQAEELLKRAKLQMQEEKARLIEDVRIEMAHIVVTATGKILEREFSAEDQKRLLAALSKEMQSVKK